MAHIKKVSLDDAHKALSNLLNEDNIPTNEKAKRAFFIVAAVQRIYRAFDFEMTMLTVTVQTNSTGVGDLSDLNLGPVPAIQFVTSGSNQAPYDYVGVEEFDQFTSGDRKYTVVLNEDSDYELHTTEADTTLTVKYAEAPEISDNTPVVFTSMLIAKGAIIYYYQSTDRESDTSLEEDQFRIEINETIEAQERRRPQRQAQSLRDRAGTYMGRQ